MWLDDVTKAADNWGWCTIAKDPSNGEEPEGVNIIAPDGASRQKKEPKHMNKKAPLAHCTTIAKKVARKQLAIEDLKKKKGFPMQDCADCEAKNIQWNDMISTQNLQRHKDEDSRAELIKEQDERNAKNTEDLKKLQDEIVQLKNVAKIEEVKMEALTKSLGKVEEEVRFYKGRLFPDYTPAHGATHAASVSMISR